LGLVKEDKEGVFEKTSPINFAAGLQDNLLLVHGMLDDNVLFQDTARLYQKLIENGRYFDSLSYPRDDHSISKDTSRPHVMSSILRYLYEKLNQP
jgi:dipeptidyl-peptidase-4